MIYDEEIKKEWIYARAQQLLTLQTMAAKEIPGYIWDPQTNRYYKDDGSPNTLQIKQRIAQGKQENLLIKIPLIKLTLEKGQEAMGPVKVIPEANNTTKRKTGVSQNPHQLIMENRMGYRPSSSTLQFGLLPAQTYADWIIADIPILPCRYILSDESNWKRDNSYPIFDGVYFHGDGSISWFRNVQVVRQFSFSLPSETSAASHRDDRLFFFSSAIKVDAYCGVWAKIKEDGQVSLFRTRIHDLIQLSALVPKQYLFKCWKAPLCLLATENQLLYVYISTGDPDADLYIHSSDVQLNYDDDGKSSVAFEVLAEVDEPSRINAIVWAEYSTKDNAPTAFAAITGNTILKIVFKECMYDKYWHILPGNSSIALLRSHPSTNRLFAISFYGKLFTIDWNDEIPIQSPEIDLTPFAAGGSCSWHMQIVDDDTVWVGQDQQDKIYLWSWKSPLQPLAVVNLKGHRLEALQSFGSTTVISAL